MGEYLVLDVGGVLVVVFLIVVGVFVLLSVRRWLLERGGGTVECSLREPEGRGSWRLGIGRYDGDDLLWYAIFGLRLRPRRVVHRRGLVVAGRRDPARNETVLLADAGIVRVHNGGGPVELAMDRSALTGFLAWLEAAPPGSQTP